MKVVLSDKGFLNGNRAAAGCDGGRGREVVVVAWQSWDCRFAPSALMLNLCLFVLR